jgi:glycosyltransferase involved in cell wall biosynthesis
VSGAGELLSIIVPVYNEVRTVGAVIDRLFTIELPLPREVVVVDDGSTDGTREVLETFVTSYARIPDPGSLIPDPRSRNSPSASANPAPRLTVIHAERNAGKGAAIRLGLNAARGSIIAIQDADLELDPQQIAALVTPVLHREADVVYGSRFLVGGSDAPRITIVANRVLTGITNLLFGASLTDMETCYKIMRTDAARALDLDANRFDIEPQITARLLRGGHCIHELRSGSTRDRARRARRSAGVMGCARFGCWWPNDSDQPNGDRAYRFPSSNENRGSGTAGCGRRRRPALGYVRRRRIRFVLLRPSG